VSNDRSQGRPKRIDPGEVNQSLSHSTTDANTGRGASQVAELGHGRMQGQQEVLRREVNGRIQNRANLGSTDRPCLAARPRKRA
jgi:hypothetical protein